MLHMFGPLDFSPTISLLHPHGPFIFFKHVNHTSTSRLSPLAPPGSGMFFSQLASCHTVTFFKSLLHSHCPRKNFFNTLPKLIFLFIPHLFSWLHFYSCNSTLLENFLHLCLFSYYLSLSDMNISSVGGGILFCSLPCLLQLKRLATVISAQGMAQMLPPLVAQQGASMES